MTFNLIALFSGLVSLQQSAEATSHAGPALRRPEAALFGEEKDEKYAANHPSENDVPQQAEAVAASAGPNLRALFGGGKPLTSNNNNGNWWGFQPAAAYVAPKPCPKNKPSGRRCRSSCECKGKCNTAASKCC